MVFNDGFGIKYPSMSWNKEIEANQTKNTKSSSENISFLPPVLNFFFQILNFLFFFHLFYYHFFSLSESLSLLFYPSLLSHCIFSILLALHSSFLLSSLSCLPLSFLFSYFLHSSCLLSLSFLQFITNLFKYFFHSLLFFSYFFLIIDNLSLVFIVSSLCYLGVFQGLQLQSAYFSSSCSKFLSSLARSRYKSCFSLYFYLLQVWNEWLACISNSSLNTFISLLVWVFFFFHLLLFPLLFLLPSLPLSVLVSWVWQ